MPRQARTRPLQPRAQHVAAYTRDRFDLDEAAAFRAQRQQNLLARLEFEPGAVERALAFVACGELVGTGRRARQRFGRIGTTVERRRRSALAPRAIDEAVIKHAEEPAVDVRGLRLG